MGLASQQGCSEPGQARPAPGQDSAGERPPARLPSPTDWEHRGPGPEHLREESQQLPCVAHMSFGEMVNCPALDARQLGQSRHSGPTGNVISALWKNARDTCSESFPPSDTLRRRLSGAGRRKPGPPGPAPKAVPRRALWPAPRPPAVPLTFLGPGSWPPSGRLSSGDDYGPTAALLPP